MSLELFDLTGKVAIVTGSGRGLGKAFAKGLAWIPAGHILRMSPPIVMDDQTLLLARVQ